jgi:6,7-dimethyl-8-ribityllumazine synthase
VLTVNDEQQGLERAGGTHGNKGEEAAATALKMIAVSRKLKK